MKVYSITAAVLIFSYFQNLENEEEEERLTDIVKATSRTCPISWVVVLSVDLLHL